MKKWISGAIAGMALLACGAQAAADVRIVALGASNTSGSGRGRTNGGVAMSQAYPAQLEALLKRKGLNANVTNAGIPGDTTGGMLSRLDSAVPSGTSIVILQPGGNDGRRGQGASRHDNIMEIKRRLSARHIKVIVLDHLGRIAPKGARDPDGQHFNAQGHATFAAWLVPKVMAAARAK
jgi:acyl-CoA thioesterase-1